MFSKEDRLVKFYKALFAHFEDEYLLIFFKNHPLDLDNFDKTPLILFAYQAKRMATVDFLLANKAEVDLVDNQGMTVLMQAILNNDLTMVEKLLEFGASVNKSNNVTDISPLCYAVAGNQQDIIMALLAEKADKDRACQIKPVHLRGLLKNSVEGKAALESLIAARSKWLGFFEPAVLGIKAVDLAKLLGYDKAEAFIRDFQTVIEMTEPLAAASSFTM